MELLHFYTTCNIHNKSSHSAIQIYILFDKHCLLLSALLNPFS